MDLNLQNSSVLSVGDTKPTHQNINYSSISSQDFQRLRNQNSQLKDSNLDSVVDFQISSTIISNGGNKHFEYQKLQENEQNNLSETCEIKEGGQFQKSVISERAPIKLYARRYYMLVLFSICTMMNGAGWISFAPLSDVLKSTYGVSIFVINYMSQVFMVVFVPMNFPSVAALDKRGLRFGIVIGITLTCLGCWMRCLINYSFYWALAGQTVLAICQPFLLNAPPKLSGNWFGEKERIYATSIGANANVLGISLGCFLPSIFVQDSDILDPASARYHIFQVMLVTAIISTVVCIPVLFTFQDRPPTPSAYDEVQVVQTSLKDDMISLVKNKGFMLASLSSGINITYFGAITTVLPQMTGIYGFTPTEGSYFGTTFQIVGIVGSILTSILLTFKPYYKLIACLLTFLTLLALILSYYAIASGSFAFVMIALSLNGFFNSSIFSVAYEQGVELSYPIGEATSGGVFNIFNNIFGFLLIMILTPILNNNDKIDVLISCIIMGATLLLAFVCMAVGKFRMLRTEHFEKMRQLQQNQ
eukprot:403371011